MLLALAGGLSRQKLTSAQRNAALSDLCGMNKLQRVGHIKFEHIQDRSRGHPFTELAWTLDGLCICTHLHALQHEHMPDHLLPDQRALSVPCSLVVFIPMS